MARIALLGAASGAILWSTLAVLNHAGGAAAVALHLVANSLVCLDLFDLLARLYVVGSGPASRLYTPEGLRETALTTEQRKLGLQDYAIVLSVHELGDEVYDVIRALEGHRDRVWIIDDASSDRTTQRLRHAGWRCMRSERNHNKPGAIRQLLAELPREIETVVVMDPDVVIRNAARGGLSDLESTLYDFQRSGAAAFAPAITVRDRGFLSRLQEFEYTLSISLGRASLMDMSVLSGVAVYARKSLETALERHSLSVYAEDLETAVILLARGEKIYFDGRLQVETEAKQTVRGLFSQRVGWSFGLLKVYIERLPEILRIARRGPFAAYQYVVYLGLFCIVMMPVKILAILLLFASLCNGVDELLGFGWIPDTAMTSPLLFADVYFKYWIVVTLALLLVIPKRRWRALAPTVYTAFTLYAAAQALSAIVGYANWIALRLFGRRAYHDHYDTNPQLGAARSAWYEADGEPAA